MKARRRGRQATENPDTVAVMAVFNEELAIMGKILITKRYVGGVVVVDDASFDSTATNAEFAGARVLKLHSNRGLYPALQAGTQAAISRGAQRIVLIAAWSAASLNGLPHVLKTLASAEVDIAWPAPSALDGLSKNPGDGPNGRPTMASNTMPPYVVLDRKAAQALTKAPIQGPEDFTTAISNAVERLRLKTRAVSSPRTLEAPPPAPASPLGILDRFTMRHPLLLTGGPGLMAALLGLVLLLSTGGAIETPQMIPGLLAPLLVVAGVTLFCASLVLHTLARWMG